MDDEKKETPPLDPQTLALVAACWVRFVSGVGLGTVENLAGRAEHVRAVQDPLKDELQELATPRSWWCAHAGLQANFAGADLVRYVEREGVDKDPDGFEFRPADAGADTERDGAEDFPGDERERGDSLRDAECGSLSLSVSNEQSVSCGFCGAVVGSAVDGAVAGEPPGQSASEADVLPVGDATNEDEAALEEEERRKRHPYCYACG
jgi:hypothetical protein